MTITPQVENALRMIALEGLNGNSVAEVAERLVCEALRNDMKRLRQTLLEADATVIESNQRKVNSNENHRIPNR